MATSLTLQNDASLAQGYVKVNGTTSATFTTSGITGNLTGNVTGNVTGSLTAGGSLTLATAQTASGTAVDFTGIPSWVKRITVMLNAISTNGSSALNLRVGSGSIAVTGYIGRVFQFSNLLSTTSDFNTTFIPITNSGELSWDNIGNIILTKISSNIWNINSNINSSQTPRIWIGGGNVTLSGDLDRIRVTTNNGTDTFDAGTINLIYEG